MIRILFEKNVEVKLVYSFKDYYMCKLIFFIKIIWLIEKLSCYRLKWYE